MDKMLYLVVQSEAGNFLRDILRRGIETKAVPGKRQHKSRAFDEDGKDQEIEKHPQGSAAEAILTSAHIAERQLGKGIDTAVNRTENLTIVCLRQSIRGTGGQLRLAAGPDRIRGTMHAISGLQCRQQKNREKQQKCNNRQPSLKTRCSEIDTHKLPPFS